MVLVFTASVLCIAMLYALRGSVVTGTPITFSGFDGIGVILGFVAFVAASALMGPLVGISLLISLMLHELGHVLAHRMLGHTTTRFRLVPLYSDQPISDRPLKTEGEVFFVALMGPGLSLAPMVLAMALSGMLANTSPELAGFFRIFAVTCGALNFVNLLPFYPLDGGRCARIAADNFWPALAPGLTVFMSTAMFVAGLRTGSVALIVVAVAGSATLLRRKERLAEPLGPNNGLIALAAYAFTLAAHFSCGWWLLQAYF
ncbi:MAG: hypothetical protein ACU0CA_09625 [Paracoccaceae bacterium]